jgi:signal transduction histidine kinase
LHQALASELVSVSRLGTSLVREVLAFARCEPPLPEPTDVSKMVEELKGIVTRLVGDQVQVVTALDGAAGEVLVDRVQLEHIVLNLIANARDAMPDGGRLTLRTANALVGYDDRAVEGGLARGRYVMLTVADEGEGMSPEISARIFDPFFTTRKTGTGLGLAKAMRFVRDAGGAISVRSEPGEGTAVTIYLPAVVALHLRGRCPTRTQRPRPRIHVRRRLRELRRIGASG